MKGNLTIGFSFALVKVVDVGGFLQSWYEHAKKKSKLDVAVMSSNHKRLLGLMNSQSDDPVSCTLPKCEKKIVIGSNNWA